MKIRSSILAFTLLASLGASGMGKKIPAGLTEQSIRQTHVDRPFSLRATDGSLIHFQTEDTVTNARLTVLPKERGDNSRKCGHGKDTDLFLKVTDIFIRVLRGQRSLSSSDVKTIERTPRCEPYLAALSGIAGQLGGGGTKSSMVLLTRLSVVKSDKAQDLEFTASTGQKARFRITSGLDRVREARDLHQVRIDPASSGQNLGISFRIVDIKSEEPRRGQTTESCTSTREVRRCYRRDGGKEHCVTETISEPGERIVETRSGSTSYDIEMTFHDQSQRAYLRALLTDFEFDYDSNKGLCRPL